VEQERLRPRRALRDAAGRGRRRAGDPDGRSLREVWASSTLSLGGRRRSQATQQQARGQSPVGLLKACACSARSWSERRSSWRRVVLSPRRGAAARRLQPRSPLHRRPRLQQIVEDLILLGWARLPSRRAWYRLDLDASVRREARSRSDSRPAGRRATAPGGMCSKAAPKASEVAPPRGSVRAAPADAVVTASVRRSSEPTTARAPRLDAFAE